MLTGESFEFAYCILGKATRELQCGNSVRAIDLEEKMRRV